MGRLAIAVAWGLTLLISASGYAAEVAHDPGGTRFRAAGVVPPSGPPIVLQLHQGTLIRPPGPVSTVFVADSDIADVTIKTPALIYVTAKKIGETVIYAVDAQDRVLVNKRVLVEYDLPRLEAAYQELIPGQLIEPRTVGQDLVLSGTVTTAGVAQKAVTIAAQMFGLAEVAPAAGTTAAPAPAAGAAAAAGAGRVVNQLVVATPNQINLRVRVAEVNSTALKQLGITLSKSTGKFQFSTTSAGGLIDTTTPQNAFSLLQPLGAGQSISAILDALTNEGLATTLAEPNLTAISGENASFGVVQTIQIPGTITPTVASGPSGTTTTSGNNTATSSVQPLSAGVTLDFVATILDADHINLKLRPEVSTFDYSTTTSIDGTTIPTTDQTVAQTTVDLASGQSFALAGLLQRNTTQSISKVPGLGDIPYVGALFRTTSYSSNETELVIVVTPYIVNPMVQPAASPLAGFKPANDLSQVLLGSQYRQTLPAPAQGPLGAGGEGLVGPVGFRLD
ncbi:MAG TPA: pilus assembly protein N-terminal domain-containing protein [Stellaceae bacterium]|nr:pilus assembly protein N-terminal domain-containing protein [Stellaceae bacterium]